MVTFEIKHNEIISKLFRNNFVSHVTPVWLILCRFECFVFQLRINFLMWFFNPVIMFEKDIHVVRNLPVCTICKMHCAILKTCMHNLEISDLNLTLSSSPTLPNPNLTQILTLGKLHGTFCKLCRLTNCTQHVLRGVTQRKLPLFWTYVLNEWSLTDHTVDDFDVCMER